MNFFLGHFAKIRKMTEPLDSGTTGGMNVSIDRFVMLYL